MESLGQKFLITIILMIIGFIGFFIFNPKLIESKELQPEDDWIVLDKLVFSDGLEEGNYEYDNAIDISEEYSTYCIKIKNFKTNQIERVRIKESLYNEITIGQEVLVTFHLDIYAPRKWYNVFYINFPDQDRYIVSIQLLIV
jgi:hypothetical protein